MRGTFAYSFHLLTKEVNLRPNHRSEQLMEMIRIIEQQLGIKAITNLVNSNNGNIGIGIENPIERLEINGGIRLSNSNSETDGIIRWTGTDFEGRKLGKWVCFISLTRNRPRLVSLWGIDSSQERLL